MSIRDASAQQTLFDTRENLSLEESAPFGARRRSVAGVLPSGSITFDAAMGVGGLPRGRIIELFGAPAIGKTTVGLQVAAAAQAAGHTAAFLDVEHSLDLAYAERVGVDVSQLLFSTASDGEQAFRILEKLAASKAVDLVVVDSVAALVPPSDREKDSFGQCEMLASGLRRLSRAMCASPCCVLLLNQVRGYFGVGYQETSAGGWAVKLHATVRAELRATNHDEQQRRRRLKLHIVKNQVGPIRQQEFEFEAGIGVCKEDELVDRGLETGVLTASPRGYAFQSDVIGKTREDVLERLQVHRTLAAEVEAEIRAALGMSVRRPMGRAAQQQAAVRSSAG
jgi:recombination protein RecA